eukprot:1546689-Alexandrium_andersonii.AAC.1
MNTYFRKPDSREVAFRMSTAEELPGASDQRSVKLFSEFDVVLAPSRWSSAGEDVYSDPLASLSPDHFPLRF